METSVGKQYRKWIKEYQEKEHKADGKSLLIRDLLSKPESHERNQCIMDAIDNVYSDFCSDVEMPLAQLQSDLKSLGYDDIACQKCLLGNI